MTSKLLHRESNCFLAWLNEDWGAESCEGVLRLARR